MGILLLLTKILEEPTVSQKVPNIELAPGLSISSTEKVAFGTSRTDGRSNDKIFLVSPKECDILKKTAVFLLSHWAPADIFQIDTRKADSVKSHKMLSKAKLSELRNAGYY